MIDSLTEELKEKKEKGKKSKKVKEGEYNIKVKPTKHPIKSVEFKDMEIKDSSLESLKDYEKEIENELRVVRERIKEIESEKK